MAQIGDFLARLFGGGTRGLSGDAERVLLDDPELEYFNARLRRHAAIGDVVEDPQLLWSGSADGRVGLRQHLVGSEYTENLGFTDVLIVLSSDDWHRAVQQLREPWTQRAAQILGSVLWEHCETNDLHQIFPQRPFGFRFIEDGGHEMQGARLGLEPGQFVTGLLPNLYTGPVRSSRAVISVLLNVPGAWEGYQEVGRLYSDQVQFTLGTHWLDTFSHEALRAPALYRLQQYADGSFVHIVNPDGPDRFHISSHETTEGPAVLTLSDGASAPIAHMVLAIVEEAPMFTESGIEPAAAGGIGGPPRIKPPPAPAGGSPSAKPANKSAGGLDSSIDPMKSVSRTLTHGGNKTVIPADVDERILTLRETGALFQKVHFARFMDGYDVYLGQNCEVGTTIKDRAATIEIRGTTMRLVPHVDGVQVDGRPLGRGQRVNLKGHADIQVAGQRVEFRDLRMIDADGWPYLGELRRGGGASHIVFGGTYRIGRDRRCKVRLPDEPSNSNIVWRPEMASGGTIRSRNGEIPKARFYTDSIMVASEHAELKLDTEPVLESQARHCFTFVRRGGDIFSLAPTQGKPGPRNMDLSPGDEILIGNCVFAVDYPPADGPRYIVTEDPQASAPRISPRELAAAATSMAPGLAPAGGADLPPAAGLGEAGPEPAKPDLPKAGPDSFMGIEATSAPMARPTPGDKPAPAGIAMAGGGLPGLPPTPATGVSGSPLDVPDPARKPPRLSFKTMEQLPPLLDEAEPTEETDYDDQDDPGISWSDPLGSGAEDTPAEDEDDGSDVSVEVVDTNSILEEEVDEEEIAAQFRGVGLSTFEDGQAELIIAPQAASFDSLPPSDEIGGDGDDNIDDADNAQDLEEDESFEDDEDMETPAASKAPVSKEAASGAPASEAPVPPDMAETLPADPEHLAMLSQADAPAAGTVVEVDENAWQLELSRPATFVLSGWMITGNGTVGNHRDATVVIPENRGAPEQSFSKVDYFGFFVRGRRGSVELQQADEAHLFKADQPAETCESLPDARLEVIRRAPDGEEDFRVVLVFRQVRGLPDPRAQLLAIAEDDPMVEALFTRGLPLRRDHALSLGNVHAKAHFDGDVVRLWDYLDSYRTPDGGFRPFFVQAEGGAWQTVPEDGSELVLKKGDRLLVEAALFELT